MRNLTYRYLTPFVIVTFLLTSCVNDIFLNDRQYIEEYKINELNLLIVMDNSRSMADLKILFLEYQKYKPFRNLFITLLQAIPKTITILITQ